MTRIARWIHLLAGWSTSSVAAGHMAYAATVEDVRLALSTSDDAHALHVASAAASNRHLTARERASAWLVEGLLQREAGRHNAASHAFTKVRTSGGPLSAFGAYYEAEQDRLRGKPAVAVRECRSYRQRWPDGLHAEACLKVIALGYAELGDAARARSTATDYDQDHPTAPIREHVELALASAWLDEDPAAAADVLASLSHSFAAARVGAVATERLLQAGHQPPNGTNDLMRRAMSQRSAGLRDEAWETFTRIDDAEWTADNLESFLWRTHRWDTLVDFYHGATDATSTWSRFRALSRSGDAVRAATYALDVWETQKDNTPWRRSEESIARTMMLAGRYDHAIQLLDVAASRPGTGAARARFVAAFSSYMGGHTRDAVHRLTDVIDNDDGYAVEARYWRAHAYDRLLKKQRANDDRTWIVTHEPLSWYGALLAQTERQPTAQHGDTHTGRWLARSVPETGSFAWDWEGVPLATVQRGVPQPRAARSSMAIPALDDGPLWQREDGLRRLDELASRHGHAYPVLRSVVDLARVGLTGQSGPLFSRWYEAWERDLRLRRTKARAVGAFREPGGRRIFLAAGDAHHTSRHLYDQWTLAEPSDVGHALRAGFPLAHARRVWTTSHAEGVDPLMVLALMRQESNYDSTAISRVGARGAMQIMPRTGHLLAHLLDDGGFTVSDLEDPDVALRYGITYLSLLLDRFDGAFPLAIASYNAGPFNVSSWLEAVGPTMPLDQWVEHIPFGETRRYVKRVTKWYAHYIQAYGQPGAHVSLPEGPFEDHAAIVDF